MTLLWKDLRYAARVLARSPGFTLVIVLSLALGIGANAAIFALVNAYFLRPMPVDQPDRLVAIYTNSRAGHEIGGFSYPDLLDYRKANTGLSDLAGYTGVPLSVTDGEKPELVWGQIVTGNFFSGMGIRPVVGRGFLADEDRAPGQKAVCVLNYNFWRRRFQGDPQTVGRTIRINGHPFTVVGVAPRGFIGATLFQFVPDVWVPVMMQRTIVADQGDYLKGRENRWMELRGRLKPGVTLKEAEAAMNVVARQLAAEYPQTNKDLRVGIIPGGARTQPFMVVNDMVSATTAIMFGVVGFVLLIACANVANLMLLLSLLGAGIGIVMAFWFNDLLKGFYPTLDYQTADLDYESRPDLRVFLFTFLLSLVTAALFGLAPALRASKIDQAAAMKGESMMPMGGLRGFNRGNVLVMVQAALSCVLLISGGLFLRSMQFARSVSPGFDRTGVQLFSMDLALQGYNEERGRLFQKNTVDQIKAIPGVESASLAFSLPLDAYDAGASVQVEGYVPRSDNEEDTAGLSRVGANYFETMGTRLVAGRAIDERDSEHSMRVAVINETMARRYWKTPEKALGRRFAMSKDGPWIAVAGVAQDGKYLTFGERPMSYFFLPLTQDYQSRVTVLVRSRQSQDVLMPAIRQQLKKLDSSLPIFGIRTMPQFLNRTLSVYEMGAALVGTFAFTSLLLAAVGIYGVLHFGVARRTREIGIRMALGAGRAQVLRLILVRSMTFVVAGLAIGIGGAFAAGQLTGTMVAGVAATDPWTFLAVAVLFGMVALVACAIPARRASRIDPMEAVRYE